MPGTQTLLRTLLIVLALPVLWFFAPLQLHGHTGYAILNGISMEPRYHDGDLILIREQPSYHVGEVVAYRSPTYGVVLHRVKAIDGSGSYVFRGDNNAFNDPPVKVQDLIGARWVRLPKVGLAMVWVRKPWHELLLVAAALFLGGLSRVGSRRRPAARVSAAEPLPRHARRIPASQALLVTAIALALAGGAWLVALATPTTRSALDTELFTQQTRIGVTAHVPRSSVYPDGVVHSGDAIFTRLVRSLALDFDYRLASGRPLVPHGTVALALRLSADNGWTSSRTLATAPVSGAGGHVSATLDLRALERTASAVDAQTGVHSSSFSVEVIGRVAMQGHAGATAVTSNFAPRVRYALESGRLLLAPAPGGADPFTTAKSGSGLVSVPNTYHLAVASISVARLRMLSAWAAIVSLLGVLTAFVLMRVHNDEPARLAWRYRDWLIPITRLPSTDSTITDVSEFGSLIQLADRHNKSILHLAADGEHTYLVKENGLLYRYTALEADTVHHTVRTPAPSS